MSFTSQQHPMSQNSDETMQQDASHNQHKVPALGPQDHDRSANPADQQQQQQQQPHFPPVTMYDPMAQQPHQQQQRQQSDGLTEDPFAPLAFEENAAHKRAYSGESKLDSSSHHVRRTLGRFGLRGESEMDVPIAVSTSFGSDSGPKTAAHDATAAREGDGSGFASSQRGDSSNNNDWFAIQPSFSSTTTQRRPVYSFDTTSPEPNRKPVSRPLVATPPPLYQQQQQQQRHTSTDRQDRMDTSVFRSDNDNISSNNNNNSMAFGDFPLSPHIHPHQHHPQQSFPQQQQQQRQQQSPQPLSYLGSGSSHNSSAQGYLHTRDDLLHPSHLHSATSSTMLEPLDFHPSSAGTSPGLSNDTLSALQSSLLNVGQRSATNTAPLSPLSSQHASSSFREHEMLPPRAVAMQQQPQSPSQAFHESFSSSYDDEEEEGEGDNRFKPFHEEKWAVRYKELLVFYQHNGHAAVPHTYPPNPQLARWVKRQRRQCKLLRENKPSTMTQERLELLNRIDFIWDSHEVNWREKLLALDQFRREHGHCNVPSNYTDKKLATWVKCQRRQYKLYWDGKGSAMCPKRIHELESRGFEWEIRSSGPKRSGPPPTSSSPSSKPRTVGSQPSSSPPLDPSVFLPHPPRSSGEHEHEHPPQQQQPHQGDYQF